MIDTRADGVIWTIAELNRHGATATNSTARCPDRLRYDQLGAADGWRGRVVRAFFWAMRAWPVEMI